MLNLIGKANALFGRIPGDLIAITARIGIATTFFRSGLLKLDGWSNGNTLALFTYEYKLPVIPPEIAAYMATAMELSMPVLILTGLFTRFAALSDEIWCGHFFARQSCGNAARNRSTEAQQLVM